MQDVNYLFHSMYRFVKSKDHIFSELKLAGNSSSYDIKSATPNNVTIYIQDTLYEFTKKYAPLRTYN